MMNDDAVMNRQKRAESQALDLALVRRIVDGEEAALGSLYDRYGGLVYSVALRVLRDAQAAEEILQDIFHHLWKAASRFDPARGSLPGWLTVPTTSASVTTLSDVSMSTTKERAPTGPLSAVRFAWCGRRPTRHFRQPANARTNSSAGATAKRQN